MFRILEGLALLVALLSIFSRPIAAQRLPPERPAAHRIDVDSATATRGHAVTGLVIGAAVGLVAAYVLFAPGSNACSGSGDYEENCRLYRAGIVIGAAGLGALVGALIRTEKR